MFPIPRSRFTRSRSVLDFRIRIKNETTYTDPEMRCCQQRISVPQVLVTYWDLENEIRDNAAIETPSGFRVKATLSVPSCNAYKADCDPFNLPSSVMSSAQCGKISVLSCACQDQKSHGAECRALGQEKYCAGRKGSRNLLCAYNQYMPFHRVGLTILGNRSSYCRAYRRTFELLLRMQDV